MVDVIPDVAALLPHGPPMRLLEQVLKFSDESLVARTTIHGQSPFLHDERGVPAWVGLEYLGQAAAAYFALALEQRGDAPPGMLVTCRRYRCSKPFFAPGWAPTIRVWPTSDVDARLVKFEGEIRIEDDAIAAGELAVYKGAPDVR